MRAPPGQARAVFVCTSRHRPGCQVVLPRPYAAQSWQNTPAQNNARPASFGAHTPIIAVYCCDKRKKRQNYKAALFKFLFICIVFLRAMQSLCRQWC
ncbi:MAG: hypothetical protein DU429_06405 [Candidatus Tokpelaia sp.]|nr:MAG: hypothetical protein DU430_01785 [Candidatus Tokpelaia sp.]KAA6206347.1 MAG: hypothetical protein DU429_06405 [Candidatus Tokpelaia sp.]